MLLSEDEKARAATMPWPMRRSDMEPLQTRTAVLPAANQPSNWESLRVKARSGTQPQLTAGIQTSWQRLPFPPKIKAPVLGLITSPFIW